MPSLDVICVEWRSGPLLGQCLDSVAASDRTGLDLKRVVVVDNSETETPVPETTGLPLTVIRNPRNVGFGAACNQGARDSAADYLVFLNPDIRLERSALAQAMVQMAADDHVGIGGIRLTDAEGRTHHTCARLPTLGRMLAQAIGLDRLPGLPGLRHFMTDWDHGSDRDVPQLMGACLIVRRAAFEALGGFDARFFLYYEDVDLCARAWQLGWHCRFYALPSAVHTGGGTTAQVVPQRMVYHASSRILYARKRFGLPAAILLWPVILLIEPLARIVGAMLTGQTGQIPDIVRAAAWFVAETPSLARKIFARGA